MILNRHVFETFLNTRVDPDYDKISDKLIKLCEELPSKESGVNYSNAGGWQSEPFNWDHPKYLGPEMFSYVQNSIIECVRDLPVKQNVGALFKNFWINVNPPGTYNTTHIHPGAQLSGIFYVKVPDNSGNIVFENTLEQHNPLSQFLYGVPTETASVTPTAGQTIIFNSHLPHSVELNMSNENRISIAFNILLSVNSNEVT